MKVDISKPMKLKQFIITKLKI